MEARPLVSKSPLKTPSQTQIAAEEARPQPVAARRPFVLIPFPGPLPGQHPAGAPLPLSPDSHPAPDQVDPAGSAVNPDHSDPPGKTDGAQRATTLDLERALAAVRTKWGHQAIVRLDGTLQLPTATVARPPRTARWRELPAWWPHASVGARPHALELVGDAQGAPLALCLAWMAAAQPTLAAVIDSAAGPRFYAPAAAAAGLDLSRIIVIRPPPDDPRATLDAAVMLLRSEAFDIVLCPVPPTARISLTFAGKLVTLAARANTTLLLLTSAGSRSLAAAADFRVRATGRRWLWEDGELTGIRLRVATERARAGAGNDAGNDAGQDIGTGAAHRPPEHELTLSMHRKARYGPGEPPEPTETVESFGGTAAGPPVVHTLQPEDRLRLAAAVRVERGQSQRPAPPTRVAASTAASAAAFG